MSWRSSVRVQLRLSWSEAPSAQELNDENDFHTERAHGKFERSIPLPMPVQAEQVRATYGDGVLEVSLPKAQEVRPKEIKINVS
jgi:HSP20 family protein